jgi:hypothetical protein
MPAMIVHGIAGSPYVRAALLALEEKGADYDFDAMRPGTTKQQPHLSRHPFGRIPAFEHNAGGCTRRRPSCAMSMRLSPARGCSRKSRARRRG